MIPIFLTSFYRPRFIERVIQTIVKRTPNPAIHVWDNGSDRLTKEVLQIAFEGGDIQSLHLDSRNTGCLYPKHSFHAMVPGDQPYYVVSDGDFIPCVDWLPPMLKVMERYPRLAFLTLDYWPRWPLQPLDNLGPYTRCRAVGNTFRLVRKAAVDEIIHEVPNELGAYGDDGMFSRAVQAVGYDVGFINGKYCFNLELTEPNWGYTPDQLQKDPRKAGYSEPVRYEPTDWDTLTPPDMLRLG